MIYVFIVLVMLFIVWNVISIGISYDYSAFVDVNNIYKEHGLEPEKKSKIYIIFANICTWYWKIVGCIFYNRHFIYGVIRDSLWGITR